MSMWEQWRAEIDRALRDAEAARAIWDDREFRAELRNGPAEALRRFRLVSEPAGRPHRVWPRLVSWWEHAIGRSLPRQAAGPSRHRRSA